MKAVLATLAWVCLGLVLAAIAVVAWAFTSVP